MANKIEKLDFRLNNLRGDFVVIGQALMLLARKINEIVAVVNELSEKKDEPF